ncbi:hypothetical protein QNI16_00235 [Cytophagaceae bacterium YF14B1]|uniref:Outer membrane protein beta-barrel domain-containing protein n=1 Tax=Xanthocytophaga flava TaxID=3048013 RepID=A0AAE3QL38_9BACT|nr:hypothetical protein [Xanthocytophaga flavus]MDJ1478886.1 hypothetical protein [Xanthocytophaga flavus]
MSNKPNDNENEFFRSRFDDFTSEPDEAVWKSIQKTLRHPTWQDLFWQNGRLITLNTILVMMLCLGRLTISDHRLFAGVQEKPVVQSTDPVVSEYTDTSQLKDTGLSDNKKASGYSTNGKNMLTDRTIDSDTKTGLPIQDNFENKFTRHQRKRVLRNTDDKLSNRVKPATEDTITYPNRLHRDNTIDYVVSDRYGTSSVIEHTKSVGTKEILNTSFYKGKVKNKTSNANDSAVADTLSGTIVRSEKQLLRNEGHSVLYSAEKQPIIKGKKDKQFVVSKKLYTSSNKQYSVKGEIKNKILSHGNTRDENTGILNYEYNESADKQFLLSESEHISVLSKLKYRPLEATDNKISLINVSIPKITPKDSKLPISRWSVHVSYTHSKSYYMVSPVTTDSIWVDQVKLGKSMAAQRTGWQWQAGLEYVYNQKLRLRGGIFYYCQEQQLEYNSKSLYPTSTYVRTDSSTGVTIISTYKKDTYEMKSTQQNIGGRLDVLYQVGIFKGFRHYALGGLQGSVYRTNEKVSGFQTHVVIGYGIAYFFGRRLEGWIEPNFRYSLNTSADPMRYLRVQPYYFGVSAGVQLHLK